jgi:homoserine O-acetyltransferase
MMLETVRNDPDYNNRNYVNQPRALKYARVFYEIATAGGTLNYQKQAPTRELADKIVDARLAASIAADANHFLWQWGSSFDYDPAPGLEKIEAWLLVKTGRGELVQLATIFEHRAEHFDNGWR